MCRVLFTQQYLYSLSRPLSLALTPPPNHHSNNYTFFCPSTSALNDLVTACWGFPLPVGILGNVWWQHLYLCAEVALNIHREKERRSCIHSVSTRTRFLGLMGSWILFTFLHVPWEPADFPAELFEGTLLCIMYRRLLREIHNYWPVGDSSLQVEESKKLLMELVRYCSINFFVHSLNTDSDSSKCMKSITDLQMNIVCINIYSTLSANENIPCLIHVWRQKNDQNFSHSSTFIDAHLVIYSLTFYPKWLAHKKAFNILFIYNNLWNLMLKIFMNMLSIIYMHVYSFPIKANI